MNSPVMLVVDSVEHAKKLVGQECLEELESEVEWVDLHLLVSGFEQSINIDLRLISQRDRHTKSR